MKNIFAWLAMPPLAALLARLNADGEEARVVGGAVRNALLGEAVDEWDVATTALPETVVERAARAGWKTAPTGIAHGTVTVVVDHHPFEVTTLREDVETDGRRAIVRFGRDFRADAFRRDFTINAISVTQDGTLYDYADGMQDIRLRRVRFIGNPDQRIAEDYLRILRLFRFHARYGEGPADRESLAAAIRGREGIRQLSAERIRAEMLKLVMAKRASDILCEMDGAGFLPLILGGIARPPAFRRLTELESRLGIEPDALRRLGTLSLFTRADAERLISRLRLSNAEARRLADMARTIEDTRHAPSQERARALLYRLGRAGFTDGILAAAADLAEEDFAPALSQAVTWTIPSNPFRGSDITRLGVSAGPLVGVILNAAERQWIEAGFPADKQLQRAMLETAVQQVRTDMPSSLD